MQKKRLFSGLKEQRGVRNRKKVAKIPIFCFRNGFNRRNGANPAKNAEHHGQQPKTRKKKGARYADASRKTNLAGIAEIYASLAPYCS